MSTKGDLSATGSTSSCRQSRKDKWSPIGKKEKHICVSTLKAHSNNWKNLTERTQTLDGLRTGHLLIIKICILSQLESLLCSIKLGSRQEVHLGSRMGLPWSNQMRTALLNRKSYKPYQKSKSHRNSLSTWCHLKFLSLVYLEGTLLRLTTQVGNK